MIRLLLVSSLAATAALAQGVITRQPIISAKSGVIQYLEGDVFLNDRLLETKIGKFEEMKDGTVLRTTEGRAEVLLTPGSFLRMAEASSVKMYDARLASTRMEVLTGSVIVQVSDIEKEKDHNLTFISKDSIIELRKGGIYRIDADLNSLKVYKGEAQVERAGTAKIVGASKSATLAGELAIAKFDNTTGDELYRWAKTRSGYLAVANVGAANSLLGSGYGYGMASNAGAGCFGGTNSFSGFNGRWNFNPYFNMFTYVPCNGMYRDPYGYSYYSPYTVQRVYYGYNPPAGIGGGVNPRPTTSTGSAPSFTANHGGDGYTGTRADTSGFIGSSSGGAVSSGTSMGSSPSFSTGASNSGGSTHGGGGTHK
jgi:hypothetical protein